MTQYALKAGNNPAYNVANGVSEQQVNFDVPTNPIFKNDETNQDSVVCYEVRKTDNSPPSSAANGVSYTGGTYSLLNRIYPNNTTVASYLENLETTPGWKIKNYNIVTAEGQLLTALNLDVDTYFVVLFADDYKMHHVAKIESLLDDDQSGDAVEITPPYKGDIPKGTKFAVYRGPNASDTNWVAVGYGLQGDATDDRHDIYTVCARPNFYFREGLELDHNTKFQVYWSRAYYNGATFTQHHNTTCFVTEQDYGLQVVDNGPFTMPATLVDNLRTKDKPTTAGQSTESYGTTSVTQTINFALWDSSFFNIRRDSTNYTKAGGASFQGPTRYVHYTNSPQKNLVIPRVYETNTFNSITKSGTYAESRIMDPHRIMGRKIKRFDKYVIRQGLDDGEISFAKNAALFGKVNGTSGGTTLTFSSLEPGQDLRTLLQLGANYEAIQVGDYHYLISNIAAPAVNQNLISQVVTVSHYRLNTSIGYTSGTLQVTHTNATAYRRRWSPVTKTLMVNFPIDTTINYTFPLIGDVDATDLRYHGVALTKYSESRINGAEISVMGSGISGHRFSIRYGDSINKYVKLVVPEEQMYQNLALSPPNILDYFSGNYVVEKTIFSGSVENIEEYIEEQQFKFFLSGRNDVSKLLGPVINKDYAFSHDYIYSTSGPFSTTTYSGVNAAADAEIGAKTFTTNVGGGWSAGTYLFDASGHLLGRVASVNDITVTLEEGLLTRLDNTNGIYTEQKYVSFGKAMGTNSTLTTKTTSLSGAAGKGIIFTNGNSITTAGSESTTLVGTASVSDTRARGYSLRKPSKIHKDEEFFAQLADEINPANIVRVVNTINSLSQYSIIDIEANEGETLISLAPNCPAVLGRVDFNPDDFRYSALTKTAFTVENAASVGTLGPIDLDGADPMSLLYEPVYTATAFLGNVIAIRWKNGSFTPSLSGFDTTTGAFLRAEMLLDRPLPVALTAGDFLYTSDKKQHGMYLLNTQGLPTGGCLQLLNSSLSDARNPIPFSYGTGTTDSTDITQQYIPFNFRYLDLQRGSRGALAYSRRNLESGEHSSLYAKHTGSLGGYATAYRDVPSTAYNGRVFGFDNVNSDRRTKQGSPETRGQRPASGSSFQDFYIYDDTAETPKNLRFAQYNSVTNGSLWLPTTSGATNAMIGHRENSIAQHKDRYEIIDPKMARWFLFGLADYYPESMKRFNHIGFTNRDFTKYALFLKGKPTLKNSNVTHTDYIGSAPSEEITDENFEVLSIAEASITADKMRRFGLMRLTELTFDWHFNLVNTEYPYDKEGVAPFNTIRFLTIEKPSFYSGITYDPQIALATDYSSNYTVIALGTNGNTVDGAGGSKIFGADSEVTGGTAKSAYVYAEDGSFIGHVASSDNNSITLDAPANTVNGLHYANDQPNQTGNLYMITTVGSETYKTFELRGRGNKTSFAEIDSSNPQNLVMTQGAVFNSDYPGSAAHAKWDSSFGTASVFAGDQYLALPLILHTTKTASYTSHLLQSTQNVFDNNAEEQNSPTASEVLNSMSNEIFSNSLYRGLKAVVLDGFPIENMDKFLSKAGMVLPTDYRNFHEPDIGSVNSFVTVFNSYTLHGGSPIIDLKFAEKDSNDVVNTKDATQGVGAGVHFVMKPILNLASSDAAVDTVGLNGHKPNGSSANLARITLTLNGDANDWIRYAPNLTGCYLASTEGNRYGTSVLNSAYTGSYPGSTWDVNTSTDVNKAASVSVEGLTPQGIHYIMSHEVVTSGGTRKHILIIDNYTGYESLAYRVMQPNETCMWGNSPASIDLYKMSSAYTRNPDGDMYSNTPHFDRFDEENISGNEAFYGYNDAVQSMYVLVDTETNGSANHIIPRTLGKVFGSSKKFEDGSYDVYLNDGDKGYRRSMSVETGPNRCKLTFSGSNNHMTGLISVGEIFTLKSFIPTKLSEGVANIATTVTICDEAENIIKDAMEGKNVDFTADSKEFPYFTGPNFTGVALSDVISNMASLKDRRIFIDENGISLQVDDGTFTYTDLEISDKNTTIQIVDISRNESVYDFYNEIIVYGSGVKSVKRERKSINQIGLKTLEVFDNTLVSQNEVDKKAEELLILHSTVEDRMTVQISTAGTELIQAGDIITINYPSEGIGVGQYVVLEMRRKMGSVSEMEIGKYQQNLTDRIAEILVQNKETAAFLRGDRFKVAAETVDFIDTTKVKEIKLVVQKKTKTGTPFTLGFGSALNTATKPLGFDSANGSVSQTVILEETL